MKDDVRERQEKKVTCMKDGVRERQEKKVTCLKRRRERKTGERK